LRPIANFQILPAKDDEIAPIYQAMVLEPFPWWPLTLEDI